MHIVQRVNNSSVETNNISEVNVIEVLDQLDAMMLKFGRAMSSDGPFIHLGVTPPQYMLLRTLSHEGASRVCDAATLLGVGNPAASMLIKSLESRGLVHREQDPDDRRAVQVAITDEGREIVSSGEQFRREALLRHTKSVGLGDMETFMRVLGVFMEAMATEHGSNGTEQL